MDKKQAIELVKEYKRLLAEQLPLIAVYMYGSYSKDTFTADSDIDVAVIVEKTSVDFFHDTPMLWQIRRRVSTLIEPVLLSSDSDDPLYKDVMTTGIAV